jgi:hypothetical protein
MFDMRYALHSLRGQNVDDSEARLVMSRELLSLGDHAAACELLIDANIEHPSFDRLHKLTCLYKGDNLTCDCDVILRAM